MSGVLLIYSPRVLIALILPVFIDVQERGGVIDFTQPGRHAALCVEMGVGVWIFGGHVGRRGRQARTAPGLGVGSVAPF